MTNHIPTSEQALIIQEARTSLIALSDRSHKSRGLYQALIDEDDFERINKYAWTARITMTNASTGKETIYAIRREYIKGVKKLIFMHNEVLRRTPDALQADHINRNTLDNRKQNLRILTPTQNALNTERVEKAKGYFYHKTLKKFICRWRGVYIGCFKTEVEAIFAIERAKNV